MHIFRGALIVTIGFFVTINVLPLKPMSPPAEQNADANGSDGPFTDCAVNKVKVRIIEDIVGGGNLLGCGL